MVLMTRPLWQQQMSVLLLEPDVAIESADVTLMGGSLAGVVKPIAISKATLLNIKQNLLGAFIYNVLGNSHCNRCFLSSHWHLAKSAYYRRCHGIILLSLLLLTPTAYDFSGGNK